ncbi:MAG: hypothetical protein AAFZ52_01215, partial [Bacteroidota bacterium]
PIWLPHHWYQSGHYRPRPVGLHRQDIDLNDSSGTVGFYQKMGILNDVSYISPPGTDTRERWFNQLCVSSAITGVSMLARAAVIFQAAGVWPVKVADFRERGIWAAGQQARVLPGWTSVNYRLAPISFASP